MHAGADAGRVHQDLDDVLVELRMLDDPEVQEAHARRHALPLLRQLDPVARTVRRGELLEVCLGLERATIDEALAHQDGGFDLDGRLLEHLVTEEAVKLRARREARRRVDAEERGVDEAPEGITLRDLIAEPDVDEDWRIARVQPAGTRVLFAAQTGAGKTVATGNLARCLLDGDALLGRYRTKPITGTLALLDFEMGRCQLREWLRAQGIRNDDRLIVFPMRGKAAAFDIMAEPIRQLWAERLRSLGVAYLVLDCLRPCLDALGLDENHEAGVFLVALDSLLVAAGIPDAVIVHHFGHTHERSRGDSRIRDWCDVEWTLVRQGGEPDAPRFFRAFGRDVDEPEQQLVFDPATRRLTILGGSRKEAAATGARGAVLVVLAEASDPLTTTAIVEALADSEHSRAAVRDGLKLGISDGAIATEPGPRRAVLHRLSSAPAHSLFERAAEAADSSNRPGKTGALKPATDKDSQPNSPSAPECAATAPANCAVSAPNPIEGWRTAPLIDENANDEGTDGDPRVGKYLPLDPDRFAGMDWGQERAARLKEIRSRQDEVEL